MENAFFIFSESIVFLLPLHDSCIEEDIQLHEISWSNQIYSKSVVVGSIPY